MENKFNTLVNENTRELMERLKYKTIIGCKWVSQTKYEQDGTIKKTLNLD